jgi:hypothetical protein
MRLDEKIAFWETFLGSLFIYIKCALKIQKSENKEIGLH